MFQILIKKEIRHGLISLRYLLTLVLTVALFAACGIFSIHSYTQRRADFEDQRLEQQNSLQQEAQQLNTLASSAQYIIRQPKETEIISSGEEKLLPDRIQFSAFWYANYTNIDRLNYRLLSGIQLDWIFIIGMLLSFVALILTFDQISGEREKGTLRLQCANAVSRFTLIMSKYAAALALMAIALVIGILVNLIIVRIGLREMLLFKYPGQLLVLLVIFLVYISLFLLLGLFVSSRVHLSSSSLAICLLIWTTLLVFIPGAGSMIGQKIHRIQSSYEYEQKRDTAWNDIWMNAPEPKARGYSNGRDFPYLAERVKLVNQLSESNDRFRNDRFYELLGQVRFARSLTMISPYSLLRYAAESITGTGLESFVHFYESGKIYREIFHQFIIQKDAADPDSYHQICSWHPEAYSDKPVLLEDIPVFNAPAVSTWQGILGTKVPLLALVAANLLIGIMAFASFMRYDIR